MKVKWGFALLLSSLVVGWAVEAKDSNPLVLVKGGSLEAFWRKSKKASKKELPIRVGSLQVQVHQVTNQEFIAFLSKNTKWKKSQVSPLFSDANYLAQFESDLEIKPGNLLEAPVTNVSWFAAKAFCQERGLRLPSVYEWEYLAATDEKNDFA